MWKRNESQTRKCNQIRQACIRGRVGITLCVGVNQENVQNLGGRSLVVGSNWCPPWGSMSGEREWAQVIELQAQQTHLLPMGDHGKGPIINHDGQHKNINCGTQSDWLRILLISGSGYQWMEFEIQVEIQLLSLGLQYLYLLSELKLLTEHPKLGNWEMYYSVAPGFHNSKLVRWSLGRMKQAFALPLGSPLPS